jgi:endonuclease/exonuclease/phosphatase (EEP) superfamily protein YafD
MLLALIATVALVRHLPLEESFPWVAVEAILPWVFLVSTLEVVVELVLRHRIRLAISIAAACALGILVIPDSIPRGQPEAHTTVRVFAGNVYGPSISYGAFGAEIRQADADIVSLEELTPEWAAGLRDQLAPYPYQILIPRPCCHGIGLVSRHPIHASEIVDIGEGIPAIHATLRIEGRLLDVWAVHTLPPNQSSYIRPWVRQCERLGERFRSRQHATIAMGDFNASPTSRTYRRLIEQSGLDGVHERVGRGHATTWPNGMLPLPPIRLDHALVSPDVAVIDVREGRGAGSDHRPVIATLRF